MDRLDIPSTQASPQDLATIQTTNAKLVQQGLDKLGANLLLNKVSRVAQAVSSTTYVKLTEWQAQVVTSGGLIAIWWESYLKYDGAGNLNIQLLIDDLPVKTVAGLGLTGNSVVQSPLTWVGQLNAGSHTIKFQALVNAGTQTVGNASSDSTLYVVELLKG